MYPLAVFSCTGCFYIHKTFLKSGGNFAYIIFQTRRVPAGLIRPLTFNVPHLISSSTRRILVSGPIYIIPRFVDGLLSVRKPVFLEVGMLLGEWGFSWGHCIGALSMFGVPWPRACSAQAGVHRVKFCDWL